MVYVNNKYYKKRKREVSPEIFIQDENENPNNYIFIGVNSYRNNGQTPKSEAYVAFDVIKGELNYQNMSQISCNYKNHNLGNVFETFKNKERNGIQTSILDLNQLFDEKNPLSCEGSTIFFIPHRVQKFRTEIEKVLVQVYSNSGHKAKIVVRIKSEIQLWTLDPD